MTKRLEQWALQRAVRNARRHGHVLVELSVMRCVGGTPGRKLCPLIYLVDEDSAIDKAAAEQFFVAAKEPWLA